MKILFVLDDFLPDTFTGQSIVTYNLAQGLRKMGHEIFVVARVQDKSREGVENYDNLKVYRIYSKYPERLRNYLCLYNPQTVYKFRQIISEIKPDVCHFHNVHEFISYHCFKIARKHSRSVFLTVHDMMLISYGKLTLKNNTFHYKVNILDDIKLAGKRYNPFRNLFIKFYLKNIDKIFCISRAQEEILNLNGILNTQTVHNAIDIDSWQASDESIDRFKAKYNLDNKIIILFGGRLSGAKGGEAILNAMPRVAEKISDSVLLVVGDINDYAGRMIKLAEKSGLTDKLVFTGWLSREEMRCAFFCADICVTPSVYFDPFNLFNIEAMAAKKPVVGTCFGGTPEIVVDQVTGYIVNPLKTEDLAQRIVDLLKNPDKAVSFGLAGYQRVKDKFSVDGQVRETLAFYSRFLGG